jgi:hypothetical protein
MKGVLVFKSEALDARHCRITDSDGRIIESAVSTALLGFLADGRSSDKQTLKVVFNMADFLRPIKELLPKNTLKIFENGGSVHLGEHGEFKLFYRDSGKGKKFGVNHKSKGYDITIYDLVWYFPDARPQTLDAVKSLAQELLSVLKNMGLESESIISPAAIYEDCVLERMALPTIYTLSKECVPMMETAMNYIREWRTAYKVGIFEKGQAFDFDLSSAYPYIMANLPNMYKAKFYHEKGGVPGEAAWGLSLADINVQAEVSPLVCYDEGNYRGAREDYISNEETDYLRETGKGTVDPKESWYFVAGHNYYKYVLSENMKRLYEQRKVGGLQAKIAKSASVAVWGKLHQMSGDIPAKFCNFVYASMVASRCRLAVTRFIDRWGLEPDLVSVTVDGLIATRDIPGIPETSEFGQWRKNPASEAVVLSSDFQWIGDKKQLGVTAGEIIQAIKEHPNRQEYLKIYLPTMQHDRDFGSIPLYGRDLLKRVYDSKAVGI